MKEKNIFTADRIYTASTNKVVLNVHCGSFPIDKIKFRVGSYETKVNVDYYLDFPTMQALAADAESGRLFTKLAKERIAMFSGYEKDGQIISRQLNISFANPTVFVTISEVPGRKTDTGAILPVKNAEVLKKVSVPVPAADFRQMMIYCSNCITAYLGTKINSMIKDYETLRFQQD